MNRYADLKEKRISTLTNQHSYKVSQFHKTLKANCGQNLSKLQVSIASQLLENSSEIVLDFSIIQSLDSNPFHISFLFLLIIFTEHLSERSKCEFRSIFARNRNRATI